VMAELGAVGGWKVGRAAPDKPAIRAPIPAAAIRQTPALWPRSESRLRGVELEIGFRVDAALPPLDAPDFRSRLAAAVTPLPVFEILDARIIEPRQAGPLWILADMQMDAGLVIGAPHAAAWSPEDFDQPMAELAAEGATPLVSGPAVMPGGNPFDLLALLVRECGTHCGGLRPGQIVTTGSYTGMRFFAAGTKVSGRIAGMAPLSVTFEA